jgi:LysM repeat protein
MEKDKDESKEKTIIIGSDTRKDKINLEDKTQIENGANSEKVMPNEGRASTNQNDDTSKNMSSEKSAQVPSDEKKTNNKAVVIAAGVGATVGIAAGTAIGATNSEGINDFLKGNDDKAESSVDNKDKPDESQAQGQESVEGTTEPSVDTLTHGLEADAAAEGEAMHETVPLDGVYEVNLVFHLEQGDISQGIPDSVTIDQITVNYVSDSPASTLSGGIYNETLETIDYPIQSGDTLSEIAQAHHTTIDHIMELNPDISNPDLIYAGNNLVVPLGDNIQNPYEEWNELEQNIADTSVYESLSYDSTMDENISEMEALELEIYEPEIQETNPEMTYPSVDDPEFAAVDWPAFEDQPMDDLEYLYENSDTSTAEPVDYALDEVQENSSFVLTDETYTIEGGNDYLIEESYSGDEYLNELEGADFGEWSIVESNYNESYGDQSEYLDFM